MAQSRFGSPSWIGLELVVLPVAIGGVLVSLAHVIPRDIAGETVIDPRLVTAILALGLVGYVAITIDTHQPAQPVNRLRSLGLANYLTLIRGGLYAMVGGFAVVPPASHPPLVWVPAICYGVGVALDGLDGWIARSVGRQTSVGEQLDMAFDTFGFVVAPVVAVVWGQLPAYYLSLSAARYVFRAAKGWRQWRGRPVYSRPDSDLTRYLAAMQMVFLTFVLLPVTSPSLIDVLAPVFLAPSLIVFVRDYLVVAGHLEFNNDTDYFWLSN